MEDPRNFYTGELSYLATLSDLLDASEKSDRTGVGTTSKFGKQISFDLNGGLTFPLLTTKSVHWKSIVHELIWFLRGDTNIKYLNDNGVRIWDEWADENGDLGPVYGRQWRAWEHAEYDNIRDAHNEYKIDQIANAIKTLRENPNSRRIIVSAWNPAEVPNMALPPCHTLFQFYANEGKLSLQLYQRSADWFLGVPFNIASYSLLLCIVAKMVGMKADKFVHTFGDYHLYNNHREQARLQLSREKKMYRCPNITLSPRVADLKDIGDITFEDISLNNYFHHPAIKAPVAV